MVRMNFIFIFISSSDPNLLRKKSVKKKKKKTLAFRSIYRTVGLGFSKCQKKKIPNFISACLKQKKTKKKNILWTAEVSIIRCWFRKQSIPSPCI